MHAVIAFEGREQDEPEVVEPTGTARVVHSHFRETVLLWCLGSVFGVGMLVMLIGMCVAEISMHRGTNPAATQSPDSWSLTLSSAR